MRTQGTPGAVNYQGHFEVYLKYMVLIVLHVLRT